MEGAFTAYCLLSTVIGILYTVFPEKALRLRYALRDGSFGDRSLSKDNVRLMRFLGVFFVVAAVSVYFAYS